MGLAFRISRRPGGFRGIWRTAVLVALAGAGVMAGPRLGAAPAEPLTLAAAQERALQQNADLRVAEGQVQAALAQLRAAREFPNPTLGLATAKISTDGTPAGTALGNGLFDRAYDSIVSLSQLIVVAKRGLLRTAAAAGVEAAESGRDNVRRLLAQAVGQAYVAAVSARTQTQVLEASASALRREAGIARHRLEIGDLSAADDAQIEIVAAQDELGADAQRAAAQTAGVALAILLGEPHPDGAAPLADRLPDLARAAAADLNAAPPAGRPDVAAAEATLRQAEANVRLVRRQRIPDLTVALQYERNPPSQTNTVGLGFSLPLPLWNRYAGEFRGAMAARDQALAQLDKAVVQAAADVAAARIAYGEAVARARQYDGSLVPRSAAVVRSVRYAYEKGGASLVELLEAERNDNAIRLAAVQAAADAAGAAVALRSALGGKG